MRFIIPALFTALLCLNALPSSDTTNLPHFLISLERTVDGISAQCTEGCAWKTVAITTKPYVPVYLDESGISSKSITKQGTKNSFAFSITTTKGDIVKFSAIDGTAWLKLSFTLREGQQQALNEMGMTE
jgi:hypothetical protein